MKVLVAGWFSFEGMGTTAGDLIAKDIVCKWLDEANIENKVALFSAFANENSVKWEEENPAEYSDIVFVCGPFGNGWPVTEMLDRFKDARLTGVNLSLLQSLQEWNPFQFLYERDSSRTSNPDITFYAPPSSVPVVGVILVHKQKEYGTRSMHEKANAAIERLTQFCEMSIVKIDTVLEKNEGGLRTPAEVEALISKMDLVITTRLHGTVLSLKNSVPAIAIDPIAGGAKISKQVKTFNWPLLFSVDNLTDQDLIAAFNYCLTSDAKREALQCTIKAKDAISKIHSQFVEEMKSLSQAKLVHG